MFGSTAAGLVFAVAGLLATARSGLDSRRPGSAPPIPPAVTEPSRRLALTSLPEPATLVVVGAGIVGLAIFSRRKKNGS